LLELYDQEHSGEEERFLAIGTTSLGTIIVVFTEPEDDVIRILSARQATNLVRRRLEAHWRDKHD
jgi:uncharacterized DUF497 family protein